MGATFTVCGLTLTVDEWDTFDLDARREILDALTGPEAEALRCAELSAVVAEEVEDFYDSYEIAVEVPASATSWRPVRPAIPPAPPPAP